MFTGIVEEMGTVLKYEAASSVPMWDGSTGSGVLLTIGATVALDGAYIGASIAINGVCLTIVTFDDTCFTFGVSTETLARTNLGALKEGDKVNVERSQAADGRNSGHYVQGHVDGTARLVDFRRDSDSLWVRLAASDALLKYIVPKGYVAIDGTSLTVVDVRRGGDATDASAGTAPVQLQSGEAGWFSFMLVSHTQQCIVMPNKTPDSLINVEVDVMGKYVEAAMSVKGGSVQPAAPTMSAVERYAPLALSSAAFVLSATALWLVLAGKKQQQQ